MHLARCLRRSVPTVFVCQAKTEQEAREIHRKVWNQNAVPFLLVISTGWVRLYPGFQYERDVSEHPLAGALRVLHNFHNVVSQLGPQRYSESSALFYFSRVINRQEAVPGCGLAEPSLDFSSKKHHIAVVTLIH
jgi:hypothetical protein